MEMYEISARYKGVAPMMMDKFFDPSQLDNPTKKSKKAWKDELILKCHHDAKGVFVPADNIRMMIVGSQQRPGAAKILGSFIEKGKATQYTSFAEGCIWILGPDDPLKCYVKPGRKVYDDYDERSFPMKQGGRQLTRRPIIKLPWSVEFTVQVTGGGFGADKVREFFEVAGLRCGMCAYGPTFGRCIIDRWEPVRTEPQLVEGRKLPTSRRTRMAKQLAEETSIGREERLLEIVGQK